ncbi:MAG: hypothetical protein P1U32_04400 [Legionellaceae bacterium]|nr:hypothetical protein [Legionellaceae bacterium]
MATTKHEMSAPPEMSAAEKALQRRRAIRTVEQQKQRIQAVSRELIKKYVVQKKVGAAEEKRLQAPLLGQDAPVYHKATPLEKKLKNNSDIEIRQLVSELGKARNALHHVMDVHFLLPKPTNRDLLWALVSFLAAPVFAPIFAFLGPEFVLLALLPTAFFLGRKVWRALTDAPERDFSLNKHGVTAKEYHDVVNSEEMPQTEQHHLDASDDLTAGNNFSPPSPSAMPREDATRRGNHFFDKQQRVVSTSDTKSSADGPKI